MSDTSSNRPSRCPLRQAETVTLDKGTYREVSVSYTDIGVGGAGSRYLYQGCVATAGKNSLTDIYGRRLFLEGNDLCVDCARCGRRIRIEG